MIRKILYNLLYFAICGLATLGAYIYLFCDSVWRILVDLYVWMKNIAVRLLRHVRFLPLLLPVAAFSFGCSRKVLPSGESGLKTEYVYKNQIVRDSVYVHDSVFVQNKGDTVWLQRYNTIYRDRWHTDTLQVTATDSIRTVEYVMYVPKFYKASTWVLWTAVAACFLYLIIRITVKIYLKR